MLHLDRTIYNIHVCKVCVKKNKQFSSHCRSWDSFINSELHEAKQNVYEITILSYSTFSYALHEYLFISGGFPCTFHMLLQCILCFLGDNCSSEIQAKEFSPSFIPISCELQFSTFVNGLSISDLFQVSATFNSKKGML